jgi:chromosomal replication initiation ATPase DnaA
MNEPLVIVREQVARFAGVQVSDLLKPSRGPRKVYWARQVGYWVSRETTPSGYKAIARAYCRANHSTVVAGVKVVERNMHPDLIALRDACKQLVGPA